MVFKMNIGILALQGDVEKHAIILSDLKMDYTIVRYSEELNDCLIVPYVDAGNISSWAQYSVLVNSEKQRTSLIKCLNDNNIPTSIYYKKLFSELDFYQSVLFWKNYPTWPLSIRG